MAVRDVYLKIETIPHYSPVEPEDHTAAPRQYRRDCMYNHGHEDGLIPQAEIEARSLIPLVYREYLDPGGVASSTLERVEQVVWQRIIEVIGNDKFAFSQANRAKRVGFCEGPDLSHRALSLVHDDCLPVDDTVEILGRSVLNFLERGFHQRENSNKSGVLTGTAV